MSKLLFSYIFKTHLANFRAAIIEDDTDRICRILDVERDYLNKMIDSEGNTALLLAVQYASPLTLRLLLEQGARPDQPNEVRDLTPLGAVASKEFDDYESSRAKKALEMAKILLEHGAFVDKPSIRVYRDESDRKFYTRETPLMTAVRKGNYWLVKFLLEKKANVNYAERQSGIRAIHYAIANGDEAMFDLLKQAGACTGHVPSAGDESLVHWFCYSKENDDRLSLLEKLISTGSDVNAINWEQRTALFIAVKNDMFKTCERLLKANARIDLIDSKGYRPTDLAPPQSRCLDLFPSDMQPRTVSEFHSNTASPMKANSARLRRLAFEYRRRSTIDSFDEMPTKSDSPRRSVRYENADDQMSDKSPTPYIYPDRRRDSDDMDTKYERLWEKFRHKRLLRREMRSLSQHSTSSVNQETTDPL